MGEFHSTKTRARHVIFATCFLPAAGVFQGILALVLLPLRFRWSFYGFVIVPWRLYLFGSGILCALVFLAIMRLPESPKFLLAIGKQDEVVEILQRIYRINTGKPELVSGNLYYQ